MHDEFGEGRERQCGHDGVLSRGCPSVLLEKNLLMPRLKSFDMEVLRPGVMLLLFYVKIP